MKFNFDNAFFRGLTKFVDCIYVTLLWIVCCLPVFTIGVSTSALYYTVHKSIRGGRDYVGRSFFHALKDNFKQATLSWLVMLVIQVVLVLDAGIMWQMLKAGDNMGVLFYLFFVAILLMIGWGCVTFPYVARFSNTVKQTLKNTILITICHLPWVMLMLLLFAISLFLIWLIPVLVVIVPALLFLTYDAILERIFRKYMSEEDLAHELELEQLDRQEDMLH